MASNIRTESDLLLHTSQTDENQRLMDAGDHHAALATPPNVEAPRQDVVGPIDNGEGRQSSVGAHEPLEASRPQTSQAPSIVDNPSTHPVSNPNDSTAQPATSAAPPVNHPSKPARVSTIEVTQSNHGGKHGGHGHRKHPPNRKKGPRSHKDNIMAWRFELLAALLAIGLLICEILILVYYNGKFLFFSWPHDWKINAVFAFLTTILEAAIAFYVGACMGQLKWYWFRKKQHRLDWLEIMTEARQPPGAMRLLVRRGMWRQFAAFGAVIIVLLLGVNTFTQNVITEVIAPFYLGDADGGVPINTNYTWSDLDTTLTAGTQQPTPNMVAAIQNGFYSFSTIQRTFGASTWTWCKGENCEFGEYQSLAVCSKCADITDDVVNPCPGGNCANVDYYTLKNGIDLSLVATNGVLNISADTYYPTSPALSSEVGPLVVRFHALVANEIARNRTGAGASATECAAWWCVKTYSGKFVNGDLREHVVDEWTDKSVKAKTSYLQENNIDLHPPQCFVNNTTPRNQSYCTFTAGSWAQVGLQNFLAVRNPSTPFQPFLTGSAIYHGVGESRTWNYTSQLAGGLLGQSIAKDWVISEIHTGFKQMAEQMTVDIRGEWAADETKEYSFGSASVQEQMFHVRWGWLAYPVALVVISVVFLLVTIIKTREHEVWKTSILPMIFHAFGGTDREQFVKLDTVEQMKAVSKGRRIYLADDGSGHTEFKAGSTAPERGVRYEMGQRTASGAGIFFDAVGQAL